MGKPNIQDLFDAFQRFSIRCSNSCHSVTEYQKALEELKTRLQELGVKDKFIWNDEIDTDRHKNIYLT